MNIRRTAIALLAVSALATAGCGSDASPADPVQSAITVSSTPADDGTVTPTPSPTGDETTQSASSAAAGGTDINIDEHNGWAFAAIATAERSAGGAAVGIDDEDSDQAWEVDVLVGDKVVEVKVNREGTEVLGTDDDDDADDDERAAAGDLAKALEAALAHTPGAIDDAELDDDDKPSWKVELDRTDRGDDVELRVAADSYAVSVDD